MLGKQFTPDILKRLVVNRYWSDWFATCVVE